MYDAARMEHYFHASACARRLDNGLQTYLPAFFNVSKSAHLFVFALRWVEQVPYLLLQVHLPATHRTPQGKRMALAGQETSGSCSESQKKQCENTALARFRCLCSLQRFVGLMRVGSHPTSPRYATPRCVHCEHIRSLLSTFLENCWYSPKLTNTQMD